MADNPVILSAMRTPLGGFQGQLSSMSAPEIGAVAIRSALDQAKVAPATIDMVYMGNVISAGLGQAPARQAALKAGLLQSTPCTTISKVCGSGMKAVMLAADAVQLGHADCVLAGGMESMSNAPYLLGKARAGFRLGHNEIKDSMFTDGLEDADSGTLMGVFGQRTADKFNITREQMDDYAISSLQRALEATESGVFAAEIVPVTVSTRKGKLKVTEDEQVRTAKPEKIPTLKPAFAKDGTVTAANSSSISDGAAALVVMNAGVCAAQNLTPIATIKAHATHAQAPDEFTLAPIGAMKKVLEKASWSVDDVDLYEINEAFAVVTLLAMKELEISHDKVNVYGGACAIGHPLGASGARIITTLINALQQHGKTRGVASLCIGGGEATAIAIELM